MASNLLAMASLNLKPRHSLLLHFWAEKVWVRIWAFMDQDRNGSIDSEEMKLLDRLPGSETQKLLVTRATLLVTSALLVVTRSYKEQVHRY